MKFVVASILFLALGDLAVNHGDGTHQVVAALSALLHWLGHAGEGSLFTW